MGTADRVDAETLQNEVAGLPSEIETDDIESRLFDLTALRCSLLSPRATRAPSSSTADGWWRLPCCSKGRARFPRWRLSSPTSLQCRRAPSGKASSWTVSRSCACACVAWCPPGQEDAHDRLHRFPRQNHGVHEGAGDYLPKMTGGEYEKKVQEYLKNHLDHIVIHRLRTNQPLTATDLRGLEADAGRDRRGRRPDAVDRSPGPERRPLPGPFRAEHGGDGPRRGTGDLLGVPLQPKPDHAADPFHRDGDRPAHGRGRHGAVASTMHRSARCMPRSRGVVRRKSNVIEGSREVESLDPEPLADAAERTGLWGRRESITGEGPKRRPIASGWPRHWPRDSSKAVSGRLGAVRKRACARNCGEGACPVAVSARSGRVAARTVVTRALPLR